ncbi:MAG: uracil-DNA glycosylase [Hydrogenophilales bacterium 17-61-9]|nr:MAG: uracil-DNA glycosylase [Hydrogenophilales bacterium 17-61-9]
MLSRDDIFNELGIGPVWRLRNAQGEAPRDPAALPIQSWEQLADAVAHCTACKLHASRIRGVLGAGDRNADWLIVGEAPGADEDEQGEPFVGQAGKLLDAMLGAIGLARGNNVYMTNVLKSRPPGNRDPEPDELAACRPYLQAQIAFIQPKIILALGHVAAQSLLDTQETIGRLRGQAHRFQGVPLVATYHPAYLLRKPTEKARAWEDLCLARRLMQSHS